MDTAPTLLQLAMGLAALASWGFGAAFYTLSDLHGEELRKHFATNYPQDPANQGWFRRKARRMKRIRSQLAELPTDYGETYAHMRKLNRRAWGLMALGVALFALQ
jgi:hypothetical protein